MANAERPGGESRPAAPRFRTTPEQAVYLLLCVGNERRGGLRTTRGSCILDRMGESVLDPELAQGIVQGGPPPVRIYWRRRFMVLVTGLVVFGVLAWALSVALRPSAGVIGGTSGQAASAATAHRSVGRPVAPGGDSGPDAAAAATGSASESASPSASPSPSASASASISASATGQQGTPIAPPYCSRKNVVLSLTPGLTEFPVGQVPSFSISVVSTAAAECSFNLGPAYLAVVVKEGPVRIWSSADCVRGSGSLLTALRRGVPTVLQINWNRKTSSPGCSGPVSRVPAGSYSAKAVQGGLSSAQVSFRLG